MALEKRIERLEGERPCPACGGRIVHEIAYEDGSISYPLGEPCEACGSANVYRIRVCYDAG